MPRKRELSIHITVRRLLAKRGERINMTMDLMLLGVAWLSRNYSDAELRAAIEEARPHAMADETKATAAREGQSLAGIDDEELGRDEWQEKVREWLENERPRAPLVITDVLEGVGVTLDAQDRLSCLRVATALRMLGFRRSVSRVNGRPRRVWLAEYEPSRSLTTGAKE